LGFTDPVRTADRDPAPLAGPVTTTGAVTTTGDVQDSVTDGTDVVSTLAAVFETPAGAKPLAPPPPPLDGSLQSPPAPPPPP
jgi:hypothetical protein